MTSLLIDVGSTFIKYEVYDGSKNKVEKADSVPFPEPLVNDGRVFTVSSRVIGERIFEIFTLAEKYNCKSCFISVQMHGYLVRKADGSFSDYVSWRDKSGNVEDAKHLGIDFDKLGTSLKANLPLVKLAGKKIKGELFTLGSYIACLLTNINATHITDACASGFFLADSAEPSNPFKDLALPATYQSVQRLGRYNGIDIYTPMGDHQISFLGSGALTDSYLVNIGTATQISCLGTATSPTLKDGNPCVCVEKRPFFDENRLYTVSGLVGGDRLYRNEGKDELFVQIAEALKVLPQKKGILLGGGGARTVLAELLEKFGGEMSVEMIEENIGMRGLHMISQNTKPKMGTMVSEVFFPNLPIIAKNCGLDFIIIDNEHGGFDYSQISAMIMNANLIHLDAIVRIGDNSRSHITKLADMGVGGFLLPMTNCPEDIEAVVRFAKYTPVGKRGVSTTRAHTLYNPPALGEYMELANARMKVYAQIETAKGVENIDAILAVNGVDGVFIGPNDLSVDLGCIGDNGTVKKAIEKIAIAAKKAGKPFGIITANRELIDACVDGGVGFVSVGSELNMLINGCKKITNFFD